MGLFCGLVYLRVNLSQESVQNRRGALFFVCAGGIMNSTMGTIPIFAPEKAVFKREYASRMYGISPFFFSRFFMELPLRVVIPWLMATIIYWSVQRL
jgi:ABC-type multidrug transport system permease subunit